jgi:formylglycine-generating enzyme required for sulfatase activity
MARKKSAKPEIVISLSHDLVENDVYTDYVSLRDVILQSDRSVTLSGWNRKNFLTKLQARKSDPILICIADLFFDDDEGYVALTSGETVTIADIDTAVAAHETPTYILLRAKKLPADLTNFRRHCAASNASWVFTDEVGPGLSFALFLEVRNWVGLRSAYCSGLKAKTIEQVIESALRNYQKYAGNVHSFVFYNSRIDYPISGSVYEKIATRVDIDKIETGARKEQQDDTIKRILDAAKYPREQHQKTEFRKTSSQGLVWLAEVNPEADLGGWICYTRLFKEVFGSDWKEEPWIREFSVSTAQHISKALGLDRWIKIPSGSYHIGQRDVTLQIHSEPPAELVTVNIDSFFMLQSPVTRRDWSLVYETSYETKDELQPVVNVNFAEALVFCEKLTERLRGEGLLAETQNVDLPTEEEWEVAARGSDILEYPWGDEFAPERCNAEMRIGHPTNVGSFSPAGDSPVGCADMAGNVREWTKSYGGTPGLDWQSYTEGERKLSNLENVEAGHCIIIRGGSYSYDKDCVRTWVRNTQAAKRDDEQTGFRLVIRNGE